MRRLRQVDIISLVNLLTAEAFESIGWFRYQYTVMVFVRISVIFSSLSIWFRGEHVCKWTNDDFHLADYATVAEATS